VPLDKLAEPWTMSAEEQAAAGCEIGRDYPEPVVDHARAAACDGGATAPLSGRLDRCAFRLRSPRDHPRQPAQKTPARRAPCRRLRGGT
jgi:hypothetical protein